MNSITARELQAHATFVRDLARTLVRGDLDPEDLAQETWLRALHRPRPEQSSLRSWLAGIARNVSREWGRRRLRDAERERRLPPQEAAAEAAASAERCEQISLLVTELRALPEPYRSTLVQRYYEARTPAQIAATRGIPAATVRSHLHRGLELLRQRLDARHDGNRARWCRALAPLLGAPAPGAALATAGAEALRIGFLGKLLGAAVLLLASGLVWRAIRSPDEVSETPGTELASSAEATIPEAPFATPLSTSRTEQQELGDDPARGVTYAGSELLVVAEDDPAVLAGAEVRFVDLDYALDLVPVWPQRWSDWPEPARAVLHTGEDGRVRLPPFSGRARLEARHQGLYGLSVVESAGHHVLALRPPQRLAIRVTDDAGLPQAGVPLVLWEAALEDDQVQPEEVALWRSRTEEDGTAVIETAAALFSHAAIGGDPRPLWSPVVGVLRFDFPLADGPAEVIVPDHLPGEPIHLELPPTGSLRVRLLDPSGEPIQALPHFALWDSARAAGEPQFTPRAAQRLGPGDYRFSHLGLGLELDLYASGSHTGGFESASRDVEGPVRAGQEIEVELEVQPHPLLEARLLDPGGAPLRHQPILVDGVLTGSPTDAPAPEFGGGGPLTTDGDGRLRARRSPEAFQGRLRLRTFAAVDPGAEGPRLAARIPLRVDADASRNLGDVTLHAVAPVVQGRLTGADGTPVRGAEVMPVRWRSAWGSLAKQPRQLEPPRSPKATGPVVFTSVSGDFAVCEAAPAAPLALRLRIASDVYYAALPQTGRNEELVLPARPALRGRLLLDPHIPRSGLSVDLHRGARRETSYRRPECSAALGADGSFLLRGGVPGPYRLSVRFTGFEGNEVWTLKDLWLKEDGVTEAPDFDLRGQIGWARVTARDSRGAMVVHPAVSVLQIGPDGEPWSAATFRAAGSVPVLFPGSPLDLLIGAPGHRSVRLSGVTGELEVALPQGLEVWVLPTGPGADLLEPGDRLGVQLVSRDQSSALSFALRQESSTQARDGVRLWLDRPGRYRLAWGLGWQSRRGLASMGDPEAMIEVVDRPGPQRFEAPLTAEHVKRGRKQRARHLPPPAPPPPDR